MYLAGFSLFFQREDTLLACLQPRESRHHIMACVILPAISPLNPGGAQLENQ
jgi:hypothetical protein